MRLPCFSSPTATGLLTVLLQPFLAGADVVHPNPRQNTVVVDGIASQASAVIPVLQDAVPRLLSFPLHHDNQSYLVSVDGLSLSEKNYPCQPEDLASITINGQSLQKFPAGLHRHDGQDICASLFGTVTLNGQQDNEHHTLTLFIDAIGNNTPLDQAERHAATEHDPRVFHITIANIDGALWTDAEFKISHELNDNDTVLFAVRKPYSSRSLYWDTIEHTTVGSDVVQLADDAIEQEIIKLRALQEELGAVQHSVERQKTLVNNLANGNFQDSQRQLKDCESVTCVLKTIYRKGKECVHLAYLRLRASSFVSSSPNCNEMPSKSDPMRAKVFMSGSKGCPNSYKSQRMKSGSSSDAHSPLLADPELNRGSTSRFSIHNDLGSEGLSTTHKIHTAFAVLASLLCLGCLTTLLHRRCCNPRARADRAARREERRNRRQYRCAARKREWRDWWERQQFRFGKCRSSSLRRLEDYEEKRSLILQQEAVLESAMQHEIGILQRSGGPGVMNQVMTMAEEGRLSHRHVSMEPRPALESSGSETLPVYRSRASSGRPPSYNEFDESVASTVADGFMNYTPSSANDALDEMGSVLSFASDVTPESSVVELSPRQSSETLRTERSAL